MGNQVSKMTKEALKDKILELDTPIKHRTPKKKVH